MQTITADVFQNLKKFIAENLIQPSSRQERQDGRYCQQDPIPGLIISGGRRSRTASRADQMVSSTKGTGRSRTIQAAAAWTA